MRNGIESIKDFFAAIFFVTVGALVALPTGEVLVLATLLIVLVVGLNPLIHTLAFIVEGYDGRTGFLTGSSLNQVSELTLVIAIQAWILGTIAPQLFDAIILAAAVTMILSAITGRYEHRFYTEILAPVFERTTTVSARDYRLPATLADHVVVIGYGRQGRRIVEALEDVGETYVVIENDPAIRGDLMEECSACIFGDAMAATTTELANIGEACLIVSTVDHRPVSDALLTSDTPAELILRADSSVEACELLDAGALFVAVPSVLAADQLVENVERILADEAAIDTLREEQEEFLRRLEIAGLARSRPM